MRNLFKTKTAVSLYALGISLIAPNIATLQKETSAFVLRRTSEKNQADVAALVSIISAMVGTGMGLVVKYNSGSYYTPQGLPGQDKPKQ